MAAFWNDKKRFTVISIIYIFISALLIRKMIGTPYFISAVCVLNFLFGIILWINEYGKKSGKQIKENKLKFLLYLFIVLLVAAVTYVLFSKHKASEPFTIVFSAMQSIINIFPFFLFFSAFQWHLPYKKLFLISNLILGTAMTMYMTPGEIPDEQAHIKAAFRVSNKIMHIDQNDYYVLRKDDADVAGHDFAKNYCFSNESYNKYLNEFKSPLKNNELVDYPLDNLLNAEPLYIIPGLGITLGRILQLGTYPTIMLGRCMNFAFYLIITYIAFCILPIGQSLLYTITILPMTLQQAFSFSYDCPLLAFAFLSFAMTMHNFSKKGKYSLREVILSLLIFLLIFDIKSHAYFLIGMLPMLAIIQKTILKRLNSRAKKVVIWVVALLIMALIVLYGILYFSGKLNEMKYTPNMIDWGGVIPRQEGYSIIYLLKYPKKTIELIWNTFKTYFYSYYRGMIGASLGWMDINIPDNLVYVMSIGLLFSAFAIQDEDVSCLSRSTFGMVLIISLLTICFVIGGLLVGWTPVSSMLVLGVQGRYFLPAAPFMYILLKKIGVMISDRNSRFLLFLNGMTSLVIIENLLLRL